MSKKILTLEIPDDVDEVIVKVLWKNAEQAEEQLPEQPPEKPPEQPAEPPPEPPEPQQPPVEAPRKTFFPFYVMNAQPSEWPSHPEWARAGAVGVHLRVLQPQANPDAVRAMLDEAQRLGLRVGLVIGIHNSRDWGHGTVFMKYTRTLPDGEVIPDYWSDAFMREWKYVRKRVAAAVKDHPALAWVGMDFGLDDESWPAKPWKRVKAAGLDIWDYMMRYVQAAHWLAREFAPVPVLPQVYTMYSTQGLDVLYSNPPANLGIKLNGWRPGFYARDKVLWPYWEKCGQETRMRMLEPGVVPAGDAVKDRETAEALLRVAAEKWRPNAVNMQRQFVEALTSEARA